MKNEQRKAYSQRKDLIIKQKLISVLKGNKKATFVGSFFQIVFSDKSSEINSRNLYSQKESNLELVFKKLDFLHVSRVVVANQTFYFNAWYTDLDLKSRFL